MQHNTYFSEEKKKWFFILKIFLFAGLVIRFYHFFYDRSLWMDEVYLSSSLLKTSYLDLATKPLYYQQKAPIGFLWLVRFMVETFGNTELCLRTIPLISGIVSMFLFVPVSRYFLSKPGAVLATGILCISPALVYHSVEIKQYSTELLATILSLYLFIKYSQKNDIKNMLVWGICGALILWFSYSAIFILAGIAIGLSAFYLVTKNIKQFSISIIPFGFWLISFAINYFLFTHKHAESQWIAYWFRSYHNFMPFPPTSFTDTKWFFINVYRMMDYPLGLLWNFNSTPSVFGIIVKLPFIPIALLLAGAYAFIKGSKTNALTIFVPVILTFIASGLELYPLTERFWVFISPVFILMIANGFSYIAEKFRFGKWTVLFFLLVIAPALIQSAAFMMNPEQFYVHKKSFQREALLFVNRNYSPGDAVYVYWNNLPGYKLYKLMYPLKYTAIEGEDQRKFAQSYGDYDQRLNADFSKFSKGKRVWLIYNTRFLTDIGDRIDEPFWYYKDRQNPTDHLFKEFMKMGRPVRKFVSADVTVYLFELHKTN
ncbi:glycosyltransferase family 39 protein [Pedobacter sp. KBW06]|uniref:glycosyltransferase family 39 protein n=1 Tax=Pedobacter sp. KBW06 TaxID=2153359 RepID=UPI001F3F798E|nr:glycosyltransferase family 39 protein [Pedobacter sp. KBW06]